MSGEFLRIIAALQQQMNATFSRSDVLRPLHILFGMLVTFTVALVFAKAPEWLIAYAGYGVLGTAIVEVVAYLFCLFFDRDALRSEKYQLQKIAIQAQIAGDSRSGLIELSDQIDVAQRAEPSSQVISHDPLKSGVEILNKPKAKRPRKSGVE